MTILEFPAADWLQIKRKKDDFMAKKVLIVDDNELNRKLFRVFLNKSGFDCIEAEEGKQAVLLAKEHKPDLILMDIQMPVMDGVTAMKAIRTEPDLASIPIIAITSYAMSGDKERFLAEGFNSYISKPIDTRTFVDQIQNVLNHVS